MPDTAGSPERARWLHLARSGSQSQRAIWFILPARGASHIISKGYALLFCNFTSPEVFCDVYSFFFGFQEKRRISKLVKHNKKLRVLVVGSVLVC